MIKYRVTYESAGATWYWTTKAKDEKHAIAKFQNTCMRVLGYLYKVVDVTGIIE